MGLRHLSREQGGHDGSGIPPGNYHVAVDLSNKLSQTAHPDSLTGRNPLNPGVFDTSWREGEGNEGLQFHFAKNIPS